MRGPSDAGTKPARAARRPPWGRSRRRGRRGAAAWRRAVDRERGEGGCRRLEQRDARAVQVALDERRERRRRRDVGDGRAAALLGGAATPPLPALAARAAASAGRAGGIGAVGHDGPDLGYAELRRLLDHQLHAVALEDGHRKARAAAVTRAGRPRSAAGEPRRRAATPRRARRRTRGRAPSKTRTSAPARKRSTSRAWWATCSGSSTRAPGPRRDVEAGRTAHPGLARRRARPTLRAGARAARPQAANAAVTGGTSVQQQPGEHERPAGCEERLRSRRPDRRAAAPSGWRARGRTRRAGGRPPRRPHHVEPHAG